MNPLLSALGQATQNIGKAAYNTGMNITGKAVSGGLGMLNNALDGAQKTFAPPQGRQLPQGVQSPIPQSQVVSHQQAPSWLEYGINQAGNQLANLMAPKHPIVQHIENIQNRFGGQPTPIPVRQPGLTFGPTITPTPHPMLRPTVAPTATPTPAPTATPTAMPTPEGWVPIPTPSMVPHVNQSFVDTLNNVILPVTRAAGIPDPVAAAQTAMESGHGKTAVNNNYHGIMQWDAQGKRSLRSFNSPEESAKAYVQTLQHIVPDLTKYKNDPTGLLRALQSGKTRYEGDNADPMAYVQNVTNVPEWGAYGGYPYQ